MWIGLDFVKCFFWIYWNDDLVSVLDAIEMVNFVVLQMLNQTLSWDTSHLLREYNHLPILVKNFYVYKGRQSVGFFFFCDVFVLPG